MHTVDLHISNNFQWVMGSRYKYAPLISWTDLWRSRCWTFFFYRTTPLYSYSIFFVLLHTFFQRWQRCLRPDQLLTRAPSYRLWLQTWRTALLSVLIDLHTWFVKHFRACPLWSIARPHHSVITFSLLEPHMTDNITLVERDWRATAADSKHLWLPFLFCLGKVFPPSKRVFKYS